MLIALAVCLFALRALIPIGFMVSVGASHAAVTLCPDYGPLPAGAAAQHVHHHADGAASDGVQLSSSGAHGLCPFAAAAHLGWHCPDLTAVSGAAPHDQSQIPPATTDVALVRLFLSLAHSPRAPPLPNLV